MALFEPTITGIPMTGFTSPTYTTAVTTAPGLNSRSVIVTAVNGTQSGVNAHTVQRPFRLTWTVPSVVRQLSNAIASLTGFISGPPANKYTLLVQKGGKMNYVEGSGIGTCKIEFSIPAGLEQYGPEEIRGLVCIAGGALTEGADAIANNLISGQNA